MGKLWINSSGFVDNVRSYNERESTLQGDEVMCGRFTLTMSGDMIADYFDIVEGQLDLVPRYNIAPTQEILTIVNNGEHNSAMNMRWGLVPSWAKDAKIGYKMINARSESLLEKPSFKNAFKKRRCLIPADGFYEWKRDGAKRRPMHIRLKSKEPFGFAGLWETWRDKSDPKAEPVISCSIVTCPPNSLMAQIHDRMPVILPREYHKEWLDPANENTATLMEMLGPYDPGEMEAYEVSSAVGNVKNTGSELIAPVGSLGL